MSSPRHSRQRRPPWGDGQTVLLRSAGLGLALSVFAVAAVMVPSVWGDAAAWARSNDGDACERVEDRADRCGFVRGACGGLARGVDYLAFVYCGGGGREGLRLAALSLWLVLLLSLLGTTADVFFIEQLDFMAKRLRLSDDVAGATLMALGGAGKGRDVPDYLDRVPLVSADFWTSDHLSERSRSVDVFFVTRARGTLTLKRR